MPLTWLPISPAFEAEADRKEFLKHVQRLADSCQKSGEARSAALLDTRRRMLRSIRNGEFSTALRAAVLAMVDLVEQGWSCRVVHGGVEISRPLGASDLGSERERVRRQLHGERDRQLQTSAVREFIATMERRRFHRNRWTSVFSLMCDGAELAVRLRRSQAEGSSLREVIRPYVQVVKGEEACDKTGLPLGQVWRYFRLTWANLHRSVPGRSLMLLVRDAAAENHPVIGIAALASSAVQISVRDEWIGWNPERYAGELRTNATQSHVRWLVGLIQRGLGEIYQDDLLDPATSPLTRRDLVSPSADVITWLKDYARVRRREHHRLVDARAHKQVSQAEYDPTEDRWRTQAETPLFRSKRAETLALLLRARAALHKDDRPVNPSELRAELASPEKRQAIQSLIRRAKSERVGVAMADISVCGAVAPYSILLGGKLVAMLAASPEVITAYGERYANSESVIASSLAGRPIVRTPHLVFLGTTSLYGTEPTQYTRVHVPCERLGGRPGESVRYRLLGRTEGYGTLQFSKDTAEAFSMLLAQSDGGQRVHSIFGEGVNPRLRKIRDGLDLLGLPSDVLLAHGSPRLVYGVALARNFRECLLGLESEPDYFMPLQNPAASTAAIAAWWAERWLAGRIQREDVLADVARHRPTYPVRHGARVLIPEEQEHPSLFNDIPTFGGGQDVR